MIYTLTVEKINPNGFRKLIDHRFFSTCATTATRCIIHSYAYAFVCACVCACARHVLPRDILYNNILSISNLFPVRDDF